MKTEAKYQRQEGSEAGAQFLLWRTGKYLSEDDHDLKHLTLTRPPELFWETCRAVRENKQLALIACCITAGSAGLERLFSAMGWLSQGKRNRLDSERVNLCTVHGNDNPLLDIDIGERPHALREYSRLLRWKDPAASRPSHQGVATGVCTTTISYALEATTKTYLVL